MKNLYTEFLKFDSDNPRIWDLFCRFTWDAIRAGRMRCGSKNIIERIRWEIYIVTDSDDDFKINNNYTAYYARKWNKLYPEYAALFELRRIRHGSEDVEDDERDWRGVDMFEHRNAMKGYSP